MYTEAALVILLLISILEGILLARAAKRLLQFDEILQEITPELESYAEDLQQFVKGEILLDHPEVAAFHRRNLRALHTVESIRDSVVNARPAKKKPVALPRPDVE